MTGHLLYTEEDVELVAREIHSTASYCKATPHLVMNPDGVCPPARHLARMALGAISSAGRLLPPGSEVREEWGVRWPVVRTPNWPLETWGYRTRKVAETYATAYPQPDGVVLHRRVITTPSTPWSVPDTEPEKP